MSVRKPNWYKIYTNSTLDTQKDIFEKLTPSQIKEGIRYLGKLYNQRMRRVEKAGLDYLQNPKQTPRRYKDFNVSTPKQLLSKLLWMQTSERVKEKTTVRGLRIEEKVRAAQFGTTAETLHKSRTTVWDLADRICEYAALKGNPLYLPDVVEEILKDVENGMVLDDEKADIQKLYNRYKKQATRNRRNNER